MAKKQKIWFKNIKTGMVFPANPVMLKYPNSDLMRCNGPEDETPIRPFIEDVVGNETWVDPESRKGKLMKLGIPEGASGDFGDEDDAPAPAVAQAPAVVTADDIMAAINNLPADVLEAMLAAKKTPVEEEVVETVFTPDSDVAGDDIVITPEQVDANKRTSVLDVIATLDPADEAHYTAGGVPDARVLTDKCGFNVSASMRDEMYAEYKKG
jgi:hypothetical protein